MNAYRLYLERLETRFCLDSTVVFNELMYNPGADQDLEWIELHNQMAVDMDLSDWRFDAVDYVIPQGTVLAGGDYLVIAKSPVAFARRHGAISVLGPYDGRLSNGGETIRLINNNGRIMDQMAYDDVWPWPVGADGSGSTLSKRNENESSHDAAHWLPSERIGGTPGSPNRRMTDAALPENLVVDKHFEWHYDDRGIDYGTSWLDPAFDANDPNRDGNTDDAWMAGSNGFADALHADAENVGTSTLRANSTTHYFRTEFTVANPETARLILNIVVDDGAVVYLNGEEVSHVNMPQGDISFDTLAVSDRTTPAALDSLPISTEHLLNGKNVLSVEVHQAVRAAPSGIELPNDESPVTSDGLILAQEGPVVDSILSLAPVNLATGATAFALDELGLGIHFATNVNDRQYGNNHSWVGNRLVESEGAFIGLNLGENPIPNIQSIAFGRSNVTKGEPCPGEICTNRTSGQYTIQFTRVPNPDPSVTTTEDPSTGWATIGTLDYDAPLGPNFQNPHQRHRYNFSPVAATGIRIIVPSVGIALGTGIDEIELYDQPFISESLDVFLSATFSATEVQPSPSKVIFHEVAAADDSAFFIEVINQNPVSVKLDEYAVINRRLPEDSIPFPDSTLKPNQRYVIQSAGGMEDIQESDVLFLYGPGRTTLADAVIVSNQLQGRSTDYGTRWLVPDQPTPGKENRFSFQEDIVINEIAYNAGTLPATPARRAQYVDEIVVSFDATWRHTKSFSLFGNDLPVDPGPNWANEAHTVDDVNWLSGQAPMGATTSRLPLRINRRFGDPDKNSQFIAAYYFELEFALTQEQLDATDELLLSHFVDDGAVFYLNGREVHRFQMPNGIPNASTLASRDNDNATISRPISISTDGVKALPELNRLSVEVHQSIPTGNDIVFAAELSRRELLQPATAAIPSMKLEEEWIELFNRSESDTIDLSRWQLRGGIQFSFPRNTFLHPQEYLVIARDRQAFLEKYPNEDQVIGDYSGRLSNQGEHVEVVDARGNPADEVHYRERGRWPEYADGGHSTLELRDPKADNSIPEAWAASLESSRSTWQSFSYRGTVQPDGFTNGVSTRYQELIIGLLDTGEVLLDDISVIEDPDGAAIERIQNGSFEMDGIGSEAGTWRIGGNHSGVVISDPIDPTNHVLHLTATGAMEDRLNHAETTFGDRARIQEGVEYQVSFRAKWVAGSNQLNTHLYFNRLPQTTLVPRNERLGTPGRANSVLVPNMGPTFDGFRHSPAVPDPNQPVLVSIIASDPHGVANARLWYSVDDGPFNSLEMDQSAGDEFHAEIPDKQLVPRHSFTSKPRTHSARTQSSQPKAPIHARYFESKTEERRAVWLTTFESS